MFGQAVRRACSGLCTPRQQLLRDCNDARTFSMPAAAPSRAARQDGRASTSAERPAAMPWLACSIVLKLHRARRPSAEQNLKHITHTNHFTQTRSGLHGFSRL